MNFTANQWAILALVLLLGWLLGLAARSSGRWKREAGDERARRRTLEERLDVANARIAELERHPTVVPIVTDAPATIVSDTPTAYSPNG